MSTKGRRHEAILRIVRREVVESQERLRDRLRAEGVAVTQATLSRDMREIGLNKAATPGGGARRGAGRRGLARGTGTIAGSDTALVVARSEQARRAVQVRIEEVVSPRLAER